MTDEWMTSQLVTYSLYTDLWPSDDNQSYHWRECYNQDDYGWQQLGRCTGNVEYGRIVAW